MIANFFLYKTYDTTQNWFTLYILTISVCTYKDYDISNYNERSASDKTDAV